MLNNSLKGFLWDKPPVFLHETEERVALKHVDALTMYLVRGWMGIMTES